MHSKLRQYIKESSFEPYQVDRLIVSNFLYSKKIKKTINRFLNNYLIDGTDINELNILNRFISIEKILTIEGVVELFEFVISPTDKVVTGAIFTPKNIREYIISQTLKNFNSNFNLMICDPACGCSGFLYTAAKELKKQSSLSYKEILENNIFGLDIQSYSVTRSKILLNLLTVIEGEDYEEIKLNIFQGNALNFKWSEYVSAFCGFDIVVGNPPYVCSRNIEKESLELLKKWSVCSTGHPDLYIPFFELGLHILKDGGILSYITVNSFYKSINGRALRSYFQDNEYDFRILDFGDIQIFKNNSTYTCICIIQKTKGNLKYTKLNNENQLKRKSILYNTIRYDTLNWKNGWNLQNSKLINKIESIGTPLGKKYRTRSGIATLKNSVFVFKPINQDDKFYYYQDIKVYPIEKEICTEIVNPNKLTKLDSLDTIREQVILPYTRINNRIELIKEKDFRQNFPKAFKYLVSKRNILATRDKGNGNYESWFAYGRNQSLEKYRFKLFFPHITPDIPNYIINQEEELLFYNGLALIGKSEKDLAFMKKIMSSRIFWFYITNSSKPYGSGYFSLSRNYIKNFGVYNFSDEEIDTILKEQNKGELDAFIESRYGIELS